MFYFLLIFGEYHRISHLFADSDVLFVDRQVPLELGVLQQLVEVPEWRQVRGSYHKHRDGPKMLAIGCVNSDPDAILSRNLQDNF